MRYSAVQRGTDLTGALTTVQCGTALTRYRSHWCSNDRTTVQRGTDLTGALTTVQYSVVQISLVL